MSDQSPSRDDQTTPHGTSTMPPTPPIGTDAVESAGAADAGATQSSTTGDDGPGSTSSATGASTGKAAPAGPGPDGDREAVDSVGATSGSPISSAADAATGAARQVADAAADAAKQAASKLKDAAENADLDRLAEDAKRVTGEWTERVKEEYRKRPGVVIGAAVAGVVVLGAIVRAMGRR
ncbi:hypothetical protein [Agromyces sp. GXS1127]|uniref:hypothetical protein n=1 Tax=Agromyces sp. GXS1127 TaxID=3424181 RepID=UPI003D316943